MVWLFLNWQKAVEATYASQSSVTGDVEVLSLCHSAQASLPVLASWCCHTHSDISWGRSAGSAVSAVFVISLPWTYGVPSPPPPPPFLESSLIRSLPYSHTITSFHRDLFHFLSSPSPLPPLCASPIPFPTMLLSPFVKKSWLTCCMATVLTNLPHQPASDNEFLSTKLAAKFPFSLCVGLLYHPDNQ